MKTNHGAPRRVTHVSTLRSRSLAPSPGLVRLLSPHSQDFPDAVGVLLGYLRSAQALLGFPLVVHYQTSGEESSNMRRTIWILAVGIILTIGVSSARADTYTATFACTVGCSDFPDPVDVTFPSPSILEVWDGVSDFVTLASGDQPGDTYTWSNTLIGTGDP